MSISLWYPKTTSVNLAVSRFNAWLYSSSHTMKIIFVVNANLFYYLSETRIENIRITRLHSSRMHTARLLIVSPSMHCAGVVPAPGGCLLPGGVCSRGGGVLGPGGSAQGGLVPAGCLLPGGGWVAPHHAPRQTPPANKMADRCKNITLPQTLFVGGNYNTHNSVSNRHHYYIYIRIIQCSAEVLCCDRFLWNT